MLGRSLAHLSATVRWKFPSPVQFAAVKRPQKRPRAAEIQSSCPSRKEDLKTKTRMDLKSGCAFEAGSEPQTQERRVLWDQAHKTLGKWKLFRPKQKQNKFSREVQKQYNILHQQQQEVI